MRTHAVAIVLTGVGWAASIARADGGSVRWSGVSGPYRVCVLTSPEPLRVGPVEVSVVVQCAATGVPIDDPGVEVRLEPTGGDGALIREANRQASSIGLFQTAAFELDRPGRWLLEVRIHGPPGASTVATEVAIAERMPRWRDLAGWIAFPMLPIGLFVAREYRRRRRR